MGQVIDSVWDLETGNLASVLATALRTRLTGFQTPEAHIKNHPTCLWHCCTQPEPVWKCLINQKLCVNMLYLRHQSNLPEEANMKLFKWDLPIWGLNGPNVESQVGFWHIPIISYYNRRGVLEEYKLALILVWAKTSWGKLLQQGGEKTESHKIYSVKYDFPQAVLSFSYT